MDSRIREIQSNTGIQAVRIPKCMVQSYIPYILNQIRPLNSLNSSATLDDFKFIYSMEWGHRILGRLIGVVFVGPLVYFIARKKISPRMAIKMTALGALIGAQGVLGWYMVQSGLEQSIVDTPGAVPRVSQYRLAAHLGTALLLYAGMFGTGLAAIKDWKFSQGASWSGVSIAQMQSILSNPAVRSLKVQAWAVTGLVFLTAISGRRSPTCVVVECTP